MKFLLLILLALTLVGCLNKNEKSAVVDAKTEDCDKKVQEVIPVKPEEISLTGGNQGCTVDEKAEK